MAVAQKHFYPGGRKIFYFVSFYPAPFSEFDADINIKTMHTRQTTRRILDSNKTIAFNTFNVIICILNIPWEHCSPLESGALNLNLKDKNKKKMLDTVSY